MCVNDGLLTDTGYEPLPLRGIRWDDLRLCFLTAEDGAQGF